MELNDLLRKRGIDLSKVIVMRHRPDEPGLRRVLPWMVQEHPAVFNAYQRSHSGQQEEALRKLGDDGWVASFLGLAAGEAIFCGLYKLAGHEAIDHKDFWEIAENQILQKHGLPGWARKGKSTGLWFDLRLDESFYREWIGKLVVSWPGGERSWWRRAQNNVMAIKAIHQESVFAAAMPDWRDLVFTWAELHAIPSSWRDALGHWRGVYFIYDVSDGRGYVGSAYGKENLLGRWLNYAATGHGDNKRLIKRAPADFRFSILERVSPDMEPAEVIHLEARWKNRLHTKGGFGLNGN